MKTNVGELRAQSAYCDSERQVIIVSSDPEIGKLNLRVVEFYPDTTDAKGNWTPTFKVKVERAIGK